jgi:hypothetical protein
MISEAELLSAVALGLLVGLGGEAAAEPPDPFRSAPAPVAPSKRGPPSRPAEPMPEPTVIAPPPQPPSVAPALDPEAALWQSIAGSDRTADFEEYLRRYPAGAHVALAQERIRSLQRPGKPATPTGSPTQLPGGERVWTSEIRNTVPQNTEGRVAFSWNLGRNSNSYCISDGFPELIIQTNPKNGTVRLAATEGMATSCTNLIQGIGIYYRPHVGFSGQDELVYRRKGNTASNGWDTLVTVKVTVK